MNQAKGYRGPIGWAMRGWKHAALCNPKMSIVTQNHDPYTGNVKSETSGDRKEAFLHCGDKQLHGRAPTTS